MGLQGNNYSYFFHEPGQIAWVHGRLSISGEKKIRKAHVSTLHALFFFFFYGEVDHTQGKEKKKRSSKHADTVTTCLSDPTSLGEHCLSPDDMLVID